MKLYLFEHCPYCARAAMTAYYKQVPVERVILLNDDEETCFRLVNAKQVPILEFDDGTAMAESLDIAHKFDEIGNSEKQIRPATEASRKVTEQINAVQDAVNCLLYPRNIKAGLQEFATQSAIDYYRHKKEKVISKTFEQAFSETPIHQAAVEKMLQELPQWLPAPHSDGTIGWDDIMIFPHLRNLTIIKGLNFPPEALHYIKEIAARTGIALFFDKAL